MDIVNLIVPLFIVILLGFFLKKSGFLPKRFGEEFNKLIYNIALPVLLFNTTSELNVKEIFSVEVILTYPLIVVITICISGVLSALTAKDQRGAFIQGSFRGNVTYLGLPIVFGTLGEEAMGYALIVMGTGVVAQAASSIFVLQFFDKTGKKISTFHKLLKVAKNPVIIAIVVGFFVSAINIQLPVLIKNAIDLISKISLPSILLVIGLTLEPNKIREHIGLNILTSIIKLLVMPALVFFLIPLFFEVEQTLINVLVIMAAMPTAVISFAFAREFNSDELFANSIVNFTTLVSLGTIPAVLFLFVQYS